MKSKDVSQLSLFDIPEINTQKSAEKWQYLIVITPSLEVKESILSLKEKLGKEIGLAPSHLKATPHIGLIAFQKNNQVEDAFWGSITSTIFNFPKFVVSLNGLNNQLHGQRSSTLYLKIAEPQPLKELHKLLSISLNISQRNYFPHLIIANALSKDSLNAIQESIKNEKFEGKFKCTNLTVLERMVNLDGLSGYKIIRHIPLKG
jgi:2'-5' RNA ligase